MVSDSFDAADNWIAERVGPDDIVVTADIPLADRSIKAGASVIGNTGLPFTPASIGMAMANRELLSNLRAMGEITGGPKPMAQRDRSRFLSALDEVIQKIRRARNKMIRLLSFVIALCALAIPAWAQAWPTKPIRLIAPFAPGGGVDIAARLVGAKLQDILGQPVLVENKPGGGAMIGAEIVAKAPPDGYTLLLTSNSLVNSPTLFGRAPFDWRKDFAFVTTILEQPMVLEVNLDVPAKSVADLVALAKRDGSKLSFGTSGAGSINHLAGEWLAQITGAKWEMVHYKGAAPANADLMGGQTQIQFDQIGAALPVLRSGKVRPLAVTYLQRTKLLPDVPTMAEAGFPGFEAVTLFGLIAPAKTPPDVIATLSKAMEKVLTDPAIIARFAEMGGDAKFSTPDGLRDALTKQAETWTPVIQKANIKLE